MEYQCESLLLKDTRYHIHKIIGMWGNKMNSVVFRQNHTLRWSMITTNYFSNWSVFMLSSWWLWILCLRIWYSFTVFSEFSWNEFNSIGIYTNLKFEFRPFHFSKWVEVFSNSNFFIIPHISSYVDICNSIELEDKTSPKGEFSDFQVKHFLRDTCKVLYFLCDLFSIFQ